jgi:hypothetical protein
MNPRKRAIFIGLGIAFGLGAALIAWIALGPTRWVTVVVKNAGRRPIAAIRLEHEGGVELAPRLASGEALSIRFHARGEMSYALRVRFDDGSELVAEQYAESGYQIRETVGESDIKTEAIVLNLFGGW